MRIVDKAAIRPHHCVVFPQLGSAHHKGYFDTGNELTAIDPYVYLSVEAVETMARQLEWVGPDEVRALEERIASLEDELVKVRASLDEADRLIEAIDVIESRDFRARKKTGRPRKSESEVTADAA